MDARTRLIEKIKTLPIEEIYELLALLDEKRRQPRKAFIMEVQYEITGKTCRDFILDISEGGLFMETTKPFIVGQEIIFHLEPDDQKEPTSINGIIAWQGKHGFGVKFTKLNDHQRQTITNLIAGTE
ncbi:MAG: PilZ domain-containing protein [Desulfobulbaceae bacterium]|nr:PilZ domain-containing protein [Desulfobulbaceae bacterium]HIJ79740.1 PilZ domain-containing protein [Deltaproteobacteria bacterium]